MTTVEKILIVIASICIPHYIYCYCMQSDLRLKYDELTSVVEKQHIKIRNNLKEITNLTTENSTLKQKLVDCNNRIATTTAEYKMRNQQKTATLAVKNNNPLNVKTPREGFWKGQIGVDKQGHAIFSDVESGLRAASINLKNYAKRHKIDTIEKLVKRFAEGNNKPYINYLCKALKLKPNEKFNVVRRLPELLKYMSKFESGYTFPAEYFLAYDVLRSI